MIEKRSCHDEIPVLGATVGEFWAWAYSDILNNTGRAVFAEFIVGMALGVTNSPRVEWNAVDLRYGNKTIEVKSAAYVQSWHKNKDPLSLISFDLKERLSWDAATNTYQVEPSRAADCYVFCVYVEKNRSRADVLDIDRWNFYVVPTERINRQLGSQQRAALSTIEQLAKPVGAVGYAQLKNHVDSAV
jgi:hypothetical protein